MISTTFQMNHFHYYVHIMCFYKIRLQEITQQSNIKTTGVWEWKCGSTEQTTTSHSKTKLISLSSLIIQHYFGTTVIFRWMLNLTSSAFPALIAWFCSCMRCWWKWKYSRPNIMLIILWPMGAIGTTKCYLCSWANSLLWPTR